MVKAKDKTVGIPFWLAKTLDEMTDAEWESLCDGCARCCLNKLEDEETGIVVYTDIGCELLDGHTCRCRDYPNRAATVPDCIRLTPDEVRTLSWLPPTCAYRLVEERKDLYDWHPLKSGDPDSVHTAGISVRGKVVDEKDWPLERWEERVVTWPMKKKGRR
ncbi:YcgN family cysteine cluster protein [Oryzibacter oryziterrae]|uniref:YcgN family cysteine cluster protein n=1 Tax=Oryzibacter oryziterrae TaxID=2766474 RepID=UPI001F40B488|nr:YcgN family cysteine cluster protein [Oryzibacter oryziterrae]